MGRRHRQREKLAAPVGEYHDAEGSVLVLRGSLSPASRRAFTDSLRGDLHHEDAAQRALELLFERLAVSWTIAGLEIDRQRDLLARYRLAAGAERQFIRESLREHAAENFPDLEVP